MRDKVLVTGHKGFIGSHLFSRLIEESNLNNYDVITSEGINLQESTNVKKIPKVSLIVHLAAKTYIPDSFLKPEEYYQNNILSTLNILEKAKADGARVIFLSTYIYGVPKYLPVDEIHPSNPMNPYTQSKLICEQLCEAYSRDFSLNVAILRPFNIYGPGQASNFFIPTIISQINSATISLHDPKPKRDYIFINDLIDVIMLFVNQKFKGFEIFNVGTGESYSVEEVVDLILKFSKSKASVEYSNQTRKGEVNDCKASIEKLTNKFGWKPSISIEAGLQTLLEINSRSRL